MISMWSALAAVSQSILARSGWKITWQIMNRQLQRQQACDPYIAVQRRQRSPTPRRCELVCINTGRKLEFFREITKDPIDDWNRPQASVTQMPKGHLGGPLEFRLRRSIRCLDG